MATEDTSTATTTAPQFSVLDRACPSRAMFVHATGRWGALVLVALVDEELRFNEIARRVDGISESMLSKVLREMTEDGLVERLDAGTNPPQVHYRISPEGEVVGRKALDLATSIEALLAARPAQR